jgi:hypothetical protein
MNKAPTGPYLARVGKAENDRCWWCGSGSGPSQTRERIFKDCRRWKDQQVFLWRDIRRATGGKRTPRNTSMAHLFGDERCTPAILEFLATTEVGLRGRREDDRRGGERGWSDAADEDGTEGEARRRAGTGTGTGGSGDSLKVRARSRCPGRVFGFFLWVLFYAWGVGDREASLAGHGQEAGNIICVYVPHHTTLHFTTNERIFKTPKPSANPSSFLQATTQICPPSASSSSAPPHPNSSVPSS